MRSISPEQIILLLLLVLLPLLNILGRWLQRRLKQQQSAPVPEPGAPQEWPPRAVSVPDREVEHPRIPRAMPHVRPTEPGLHREGPRGAQPPGAPVRRRATLGGRAGVRQAIVAMTILGPCRGLEEPTQTADPGAAPSPRRRP